MLQTLHHRHWHHRHLLIFLLRPLRFLRQIADARAFGDEALAGELLVDAGHDAQQRRFTRAVDAEHADLGVRVKGQVNIVENLLATRIGLGEALHMIDKLARHECVVSRLDRFGPVFIRFWR